MTVLSVRPPPSVPRAAVAWVAVAVVLVAVGYLVPAVSSAEWIRTFTTSVIYAIVCAGVGLLYGRLGIVSLGQISLVGVGGWIALRLGHATPLPYPALLMLSGLGTCLVGVMVGLPALRIGGLNLAIVTLMFAGAFSIVFNATGFPDGGSGFLGRATGSVLPVALARPPLGESDGGYFRYVLAVAALTFGLLAAHLRSRPGRQWAVIRQSEAAAIASGIDTTRSRLHALALVSFTTGIAGGLLAANAGVLDPSTFTPAQSILVFAVVLIGGTFSLIGAVVGGLLIQAFPTLLSDLGVNSNLILVIFGAGLIHSISTGPEGAAGLLQALVGRLQALAGRLRRSAQPAEVVDATST